METSEKRPVLLIVLSVLSLITLSIATIGLLFSLATGPMTATQLDSYYQQNSEVIGNLRAQKMNDVADLVEKVSRFQEYQNEKFWLVFAVNFLATASGVLGVVFMLRRRRLGFHLYIIYNILGLIAVYIAVPFKEVPIVITLVSAFFSALWIFLYSLNLRWMTR